MRAKFLSPKLIVSIVLDTCFICVSVLSYFVAPLVRMLLLVVVFVCVSRPHESDWLWCPSVCYQKWKYPHKAHTLSRQSEFTALATVHTHECACIHMHTCTYVQTHTHTHTHTHIRNACIPLYTYKDIVTFSSEYAHKMYVHFDNFTAKPLLLAGGPFPSWSACVYLSAI